LKVELHVQDDLKATWQAAEMALYRVVQEALSNVHRHAHATEIAVGLFTRRSMTHVVVTDNGAGMPSQVARGVGLASMRERVICLGGRFSIRSAGPGTAVIASLPLQPVIRAVGDLAVHG
jgi:signal transduction histidine kinase